MDTKRPLVQARLLVQEVTAVQRRSLTTDDQEALHCDVLDLLVELWRLADAHWVSFADYVRMSRYVERMNQAAGTFGALPRYRPVTLPGDHGDPVDE